LTLTREVPMPSLRVSAFLVLAAVLTGPVAGQDGKKKDEPVVKYKGTLPANWKKLGLTDEQVQKVYKVQTVYGDKIDKLKEEIRGLEAKRDKERYEVLTAEQKKRLEELSKPKTGG
jgi:Spy/CpxP family protein refolding chaperone